MTAELVWRAAQDIAYAYINSAVDDRCDAAGADSPRIDPVHRIICDIGVKIDPDFV